MQVVKKGIKLILSVMGIVLFCACTRNVPVSVVPVGTPTTTAVPLPTSSVTVTTVPTEAVITPTPTNIPTADLTPLLTPTLKPTKLPDATVTKEPTSTSVPTATKTPTVTKPPTETTTLPPTKAPTITVEGSTVITPEMLVANGWQSMLDISQTFYVIFSECFNDSKVTKGENTLEISYTSTQEEEIQFQVLYLMQQTLEDMLDVLIEQDGIVLEENIAEKSISYEIEKEDMVYRGVILEQEYQKELLGDVFGEGNSIIGTMQVTFAYPKEQQSKYETEEFSYYVVRIP